MSLPYPYNSRFVNVTVFTGTPDSYTYTKDVTSGIRDAIAYIVSQPSHQRTALYFPPGFYYVTESIDFTAIDGWTIFGVPNLSAISIPHGVVINGPIFNFNKNNSTLSRYNTIKGLYFFSDSWNGKAKSALDFSYNNRLGIYECRTSRISNEVDVALHFCYEGLIQRCNFSGGKSVSLPSDGMQLSNEGNAIKIDQCSIDNYIGNGSTISGSGIYFGQSKGLTVDTCTIQQCDYGITLATGSREATIQGGGYFEGNKHADIRLGDNGGTVYNTKISGGSIKSGGDAINITNGLLIDGANVIGLTCDSIGFDNGDPIMLNSKNAQYLQDIVFLNCRTGDTIYSYRNLIQPSQQMYLDNIKIINPGSDFNGRETPSFTPIIQDQFTNHAIDFNNWKNGSGASITFLESNGTFLGATVWKKNTANVESMIFTLPYINGFENQVVMFSCYIRFNGTINANDLIQIINQDNIAISSSRPLRPATISTTGFVKIHVYGLVGVSDTSVKIKILTRDVNIDFVKPEFKLGFV